MLLLKFGDPWEKLQTKKIQYENIANPKAKKLREHLTNLTYQRDQCTSKHVGFKPAREFVELFKSYLASLAGIAERLLATSPADAHTKLRTEWASGLAMRSNRYSRLNGILPEQAMATFMFGTLLREFAHMKALETLEEALQNLSVAPGGASVGPSSPSAADVGASRVIAAVTLMREAAGVFQHLADAVVVRLGSDLPDDRPIELAVGVCNTMRLLCLAEAQALTAYRAHDKGSSATVVAGLHQGAADLFDQGLKEVLNFMSAAPNTTSDRVSKLMNVSGKLHRARAYRLIAEDLKERQEVPNAEACCVQGLQLLRSVASEANCQGEWRTAVNQEVATLEELRKKCEHDRLYVYISPLPSTPPALPEGKIIVTTVEFQLVPVFYNFQEDEQGGGCSIQ